MDCVIHFFFPQYLIGWIILPWSGYFVSWKSQRQNLQLTGKLQNHINTKTYITRKILRWSNLVTRVNYQDRWKLSGELEALLWPCQLLVRWIFLISQFQYGLIVTCVLDNSLLLWIKDTKTKTRRKDVEYNLTFQSLSSLGYSNEKNTFFEKRIIVVLLILITL